MRPFVDDKRCIGYWACFEVCPAKPKVMEIREIEGKGRKSVTVRPEVCDFGSACADACSTKAFQLIRD